MAKLYPPYIEGTLPAFSLNSTGDGEMTIPFAFNRAVNANAVKSFAIKIKTVQNDVLMGDVTLIENAGTWNEDKLTVVFQIKNNKIKGTDIIIDIGQFYKVQLAFIDSNDLIGYYSTVGVIKCTSVPAEVSIMNFSESKVNNNSTEFIGIFRQAEGGDVSEKVYSSRFTITDMDGNIIETTGDVLHNIENNPNSYSSEDKMIFNRDLDKDKLYKIVYEVTTTNGLVVSSPSYLLKQQITLDIDENIRIIPILYKDDGFISIQLETGKKAANGTFVLAREDQMNPGYWEELHRFALKNQFAATEIFKDFTIEQGKTYTYSLQQYNEYGVFSNRRLSDAIYADFDDMFLYDGERQLKLCFNPQVSSFKTQLAESRQDTIGSKYPFFYRNARIGYKVFPISGLVSMLSDDNEFFVKYEDILRERDAVDRHVTNVGQSAFERSKLNFYSNHDSGTVNAAAAEPIGNAIAAKEEKSHNPRRNLVSDNFISERLFKLTVLDWLNNGRVKLFKSPGEGNYLVRLMDTSLSPNTVLGRMLHTVSSTAYESAELNHQNLLKYNILKTLTGDEVDISSKVTQWKQITIDENNRDGNLLLDSATGTILKTSILRFIDFLPGTRIKVVMDPSGSKDSEDSVILTIGATGDYYANDVENVYGIYIMDTDYVPASSAILCQYEESIKNEFDAVTKTIIDVGAYQQFVGPVDNVLEDAYPLKEHLVKVNLGDFKKRPIEYLYYNESTVTPEEGDIYLDSNDIKGFRTLKPEYLNKLYWEPGMDKAVRLYAKKKNTNGLPETWWDVQDWAKYYAIVSLILDGKDPDDYTDEQLKAFYPDQRLQYYKKSGVKLWDTNQVNEALGHSPRGSLGGYHQMVYQYQDGTWGSHGSSCVHYYYELNPEDSRCKLGAGVVAAYVYLPTFPGEFEYDYDNDTDFVFIDLSAYGDNKEIFDEKENMEYSPFSLYVLRSNQLSIDGVKQDIVKHVSAEESGEPTLHIANHLFEKYYIDRYLNAVSAEDALTERVLLAQRLAAEPDENAEAAEEATAMYVLDPWQGKIFKVGSSFEYSPYIIINGENIDLNEIERYRIEDFDNSNESVIKVGNGVYGELFTQNLITYYSIESNQDAWDEMSKNDVEREDVTEKEYEEHAEQLKEAKAEYHEAIKLLLEKWTAREE